MTAPLDLAALWRDTLATARADLPLYFALTAAFVLLPELALALYGPAPPETVEGLTPRFMLLQAVLPAAIGAIGQLAIVQLVVGSRHGAGPTVGGALRVALLALPVLLLAMLAAALPVALGLLLLILPGLYLAARLTLLMPLIAERHLAPLAALRESWAMTEDNGGRILAFILLWTVVFLGAAILAGGLGAALGSVLTLAGAKTVGAVAAALVSAAAAALFSVYNAVGIAVIYLHLTARR